MRLGWWPFLLLLAVPWAGAPLHAQTATAGGQVTQIGFAGFFQPTSWVPMKVRVSPAGGQSGFYLLRVYQRDLDSDQVIFQRTITLTGGMPNQEFWTYFKPQPVEPLPANDARTVVERLRVVLCDESGRELAQLSVPGTVTPLYAGPDARSGGGGRGKRLVLLVSDPSAGAFPGTTEAHPDNLVGLTEDVAAIGITTDALPDRAIGYEGVEAIFWQDADPAVLLEGGGERMTALRQWIEGGGKLIITARSEWQSLEPFFDLLPVTPTGGIDRPDLMPLAGIVSDRARGQVDLEAWRLMRGPFRFILSSPRPESIIERSFAYELPEPGEGTAEAPLVARRAAGFGSVTWVALDLSVIRSAPPRTQQQGAMGWTIIRSYLLGLGDQPIPQPAQDVRARHDARDYRDLAWGLLEGSRLAGRSVALVTVALVFFIAYWLIAGPGLYFYLANKGRTPMSWFFFGATAVVATLVTLGVVRLILRGPPDLRHVSVVRQGPVAPQVVHADMGLYIPEDGLQRLMIDGALPGTRPSLTALAIDPAHQAGAGRRSNPISYIVSLDAPEERLARDATDSATVTEIPYRSTLKKLEATWMGPMARGIDGSPRLIRAVEGYVAGSLVNTTGRDLLNVHVAFRHPDLPMPDDVYVLFIPIWRDGTIIPGLNTILVPEGGGRVKLVDRNSSALAGPPGPRDSVGGTIRLDWSRFWYSYLRSGMMAGGQVQYSDWNESIRRTPAMLSFFDLLPPMTHDGALTAGVGAAADPTILLRRGAREMDVSAAVVAGNLVIVAEAENAAVPVPLSVDGSPVRGNGRVIYQFVLPLERATLERQRAEQRQRQRLEEQQQDGESTEPPEPEEQESLPSALEDLLAVGGQGTTRGM